MKTTIDIADALLAEAKRIAATEGTTVKALVEQGLRHAIQQRRRGTAGFELRRASVPGKGLQPAVQGADWERIRDLTYTGRGG